MNFITAAGAVFLKDLQQETRSRTVFNSILAFVATSMLVVLFTLRADDLHDEAKSGVIWIILLFAALAGLSRSFISETDRNTYDLLRLHANGLHVFWGKLVYNYLFTLAVTGITLMFYIVLLNLPVAHPMLLVISFSLGTLGISTISTLMSAIVAQTSKKAAVFSVISIPLLIPLILIVGNTSTVSFFGSTDGLILNDVMALIGYNGVTLTMATLLFDSIWEE